MTHRPRLRTCPASRGERGLAFLFVAVLLLLLFGLAAWVVDGGHAYDLQARCQSAADAAALAAAERLPDLAAATSAAMTYGSKNLVESNHGTVIDSGDVEFGHWNTATKAFTPTTVTTAINAVRVTARRDLSNVNAMDTTFGRALGSTTVDVSAKAVARAASGTIWDVVLLQDVTNSFSAEFSQAKVADKNFLDCFAATVPATSLFGIVTFTGWSRIVAPLTPIGSGYALLNTSLNGVKLCGSAGAPICSGTDIGEGLKAAVTLLAAAPVAADVAKAVVLVSDGQPQPDSQGANPTYSVSQLQNLATTWADNGAAAGLSIFVVFYDGNNDAAGKAFLQSLVRGQGIFLSTPDPVQIPVLLKSICSEFSSVTLVE